MVLILPTPAVVGATGASATDKPTKEARICVDRLGAPKVICAKTKDEAFAAAGVTVQDYTVYVLWRGDVGAPGSSGYYLLNYPCWGNPDTGWNNLWDWQDQTTELQAGACAIITLYQYVNRSGGTCEADGRYIANGITPVSYSVLGGLSRSFWIGVKYGAFCDGTGTQPGANP